MTQPAPIGPDQINDLRRRIVAGEEVNPDEVRAALDFVADLRGKAVEKANTSAKKKSAVVEKKAAKEARGQNLLDELF